MKVWQKKVLLVAAHATICATVVVIAGRLLDKQTTAEIIKEAADAASLL